jgi:hypothetical protein
MHMTDNTALDTFLDKWRSRWPEWSVAETFVPAQQRELAVAWFALLQEFEDAMNIAGDTTPADAKLAWWGEELRDWSRQRSRHPLGRVLQPYAAPWFELAEVLPVLIDLRERPRGADSAFVTIQPLAQAILKVENKLFGVAEKSPPDSSVRSVNCQWLASRLFAAGEGAAPLDMEEPLWAKDLLNQWPPRANGSTPRRLYSTLMRSRLQQYGKAGRDAKPLSGFRLLWLTWRAAL